MQAPLDALHAGLRYPAPPAAATRRAVLVVGGGGPLGSAVLEQLLGGGQWARVAVLVSQPLEVAVSGLEAWPAAWLDAPPQAGRPRLAANPEVTPDTAVLVFDRERSRHGREVALTRPDPARLPTIARGLLGLGVQRLVVVLPHAPGLLPQALRAGLASLDEQAVAALGFHQLVMVRPARALAAAAAGTRPGFWPRVAGAVLAQLQLMVPQREQPLRAARVAHFVGDLALALPAMAAGTRVVAPELLWDWAQPGAGPQVLRSWLAGQAGPTLALPLPRL